MDASHYAAVETTLDGRRLHIRALRPDDRDRLRNHFMALSDQAKIFRFHGVKRSLSDAELDRLTRLDFVRHVALVATFDEALDAPLIGVGRYIVTPAHADRAEVAFAVLDAFQGHGIGSRLLHHLALIAAAHGIREFQAEVLDANRAMLEVFADSGLPVIERSSRFGVTHAVFSIAQRTPPRWAKPAAPHS
ncbi:MAG TPA: GNAT family N-acetyltransferase [Candidatus Binataceae bacterium]|nr:GNAT family N-acetyltransferase [Candidatus Binataceae bacterium]